MRIARRLLTAAGLALALVLVSTCSNQFSLLDTLTDEVKAATGKYLVIESITPVKNAQSVNPGNSILIEFDRALDESTFTTANIVIDGGAGDPNPLWVPTFNKYTNTLTIQPNPYFKGDNGYSVTITKGLKGADGSELRDGYTSYFTTRPFPAGSMFFQGTDKPYILLHTPVTLTINVNERVTLYRWVLVNDGVDANTAFSSPDWAPYRQDWNSDQVVYGVEKTFTKNGTLPTGDGPKIAYFQVMEVTGGPENNIAYPVLDATFLDENNPNVTIVTPPLNVLAASAPSPPLDANADDGTGSGIGTISWTATLSSGTGSLEFSNPAALDTQVYDPGGASDGTFQLLIFHKVMDTSPDLCYSSLHEATRNFQ